MSDSKDDGPKKVLEVDGENGDEVTYYLQHDEEFSKVMLMVKCTRPMEFFEYLYTLQEFINECVEGEKNLFTGENSKEVVTIAKGTGETLH